MLNDPDNPLCSVCDEPFNSMRLSLGYSTCLKCGDNAAVVARKSWTVAPLHKSNYQLITDTSLLTGINNKGGLVK